MAGISVLVGEVLREARLTKGSGDYGDNIVFVTEDGGAYQMHHEQSCCESVDIEDIAGDLDDLIGAPILVAEERTSEGTTDEGYNSYTWTFYELRTIKGSVTIRWYGTSNGDYSERVGFEQIARPLTYGGR